MSGSLSRWSPASSGACLPAVTHGQILLQKLDPMPSTVPGPGAAARACGQLAHLRRQLTACRSARTRRPPAASTHPAPAAPGTCQSSGGTEACWSPARSWRLERPRPDTNRSQRRASGPPGPMEGTTHPYAYAPSGMSLTMTAIANSALPFASGACRTPI
jgi:hypothetical protein